MNAPSQRTRVRRAPNRGDYRRETVMSILADCYTGVVGTVHEGEPRLIPMAVWPWDGRLCVHGSVGSRLMRDLADGLSACIVLMRLDGLVLARSAFHHSMNYRSAVIYARGEPIQERARKLAALDALTEHIQAGRSATVRPPSEKELTATSVVAFPLEEASAKIRTGGPNDDAADYARDVWAGVIPIERVLGEPIRDEGPPST